MSADKFLRGAMILTLAGLMVKIIGSVNRILLSRLLGGEGIGLYQMAYPVYLLLVAISSAGIPIAISIIVAEKLAQKDYANVQRVFRVSLGLMAVTGFFFASSLFVAAGWLVNSGIITDSRAYYGLIALTPAVFLSTILACFRGFFQGQQLMTPPAVSQILEQFVRVMTMLALAYFLLPKGLEWAAAGAAFGAAPGALTGLVVLSFFYLKYRHNWQLPANTIGVLGYEKESVGKIAKRLVLLALPVSCANIVVPITSSIDMLLVPNRLIASGFAVDEATTLYGYLAGMAQPLILLATIPTTSLAVSLVPAVSEAFTLGNKDGIAKKAVTAMKLCCLITVPAAVGMGVLAEQLSLLLYGTSKAAVAIMHSAPALWLLGMQQITTGVLQGMGKINVPMVNMVCGLAAKVCAVWLLTNATYSIAGAAWASNINFGLAALLNILVLYRLEIKFKWQELAKIIVAAVLMGVSAHYGYAVLMQLLASKTLATIIAIGLAALVYAVLLPCLGAINKEELRQLPIIKKLIR
ncbi:MAG: polysaccharide biosynthesis protein [Phascolarctobacterium sp.]|nr:polysaccharide biosynthesis protein [Phascolarctobacterium sp.]